MFKQIHMILTTATYNFRLWRGNTRVAAVFLLAWILCFLLTDKIVTFASDREISMQLAEAFIWTFGDSNSILLASLFLLLLFSDMPFITAATPFFLARQNRRSWVLGQMVYILLATSVYLIFILLSSCLLSARQAYFKNSWSRTSAILAYSEEGKEIALPAAAKTLEMSRPYKTVAVIFCLMLLYTLVMVFLMLFFYLWRGQRAGVISVLVFNVYGMVLNPGNIQKLLELPEELYYKARVWTGWISPLNHASYHMHDFGYDELPSLTQTVWIFGVLLVLLVRLSMRAMRRYGFQFKGTER